MCSKVLWFIKFSGFVLILIVFISLTKDVTRLYDPNFITSFLLAIWGASIANIRAIFLRNNTK